MEEISKGLSVVRALKQVMDVLKQNVGKQFKEMNVTGPQGMLMGILGHYGQMKVSDLSEKLGLSNSTVSGIIDRLENQGLVQRIRSSEDRRVVYVNVTPEFRETTRRHFKEIEGKIEGIMNLATPEEQDKILTGLNILMDIMARQGKQD